MRLTRKELQDLDAAAKAEGQSRSEFLRDRAFKLLELSNPGAPIGISTFRAIVVEVESYATPGADPSACSRSIYRRTRRRQCSPKICGLMIARWSPTALTYSATIVPKSRSSRSSSARISSRVLVTRLSGLLGQLLKYAKSGDMAPPFRAPRGVVVAHNHAG